MLTTLRARLRKPDRLFIATVVIPTFLAIVYFGLFASDVYISESKFVVRSPEKPRSSTIGVILQSAGFANAFDEIQAAKEYVSSRDALKALNAREEVRQAYTRPHISPFDRFDPTGLFSSFEDLYRYYLQHVSIEANATTSVSTLTVRAYSAADAQKFNRRLLEMAEATVNRMNVRGREDLIRYASFEVDNAKANAREAALALAAFRNRSGIVDPQEQATVQMQMVSKLQDELIATQTQLRELQAYTPLNPQIPVFQTRASSLQREIERQLGRVAGDRRSLAAATAQYQRLQLETQFADKQLTAALASLEDAQNEARRKQAYVERIVNPNLPDAAAEPRRLRGIFATFVLGLVAWAIAYMLYAGIREHGQ